MTRLKTLLLFIALGLLATLTACLDDSQAGSGSSGLTEAQVKALIADAVAPLNDKVAALESTIASLEVTIDNQTTVVTSGGATANGMQKAAGLETICTPLEFQPATGFVGQMQTVDCQSAEGYIAKIPLTRTAEIVHPAFLPNRTTYYTTTNCTGTAYIHAAFIGEQGMENGAVFRYYNGSVNAGYIPAGSTYTNMIQYSYYQYDEQADQYTCNQFPSGGFIFSVQVLLNDAQITGFPNDITGPISVF